jgi:16S rRNA (uracil1498-N3)-methyltransferase
MPSHPRFHVPHIPTPGEEMSLQGEEYHHLRHVLRVQSGEEISIFDGAGKGAVAKVLALRTQDALLRVEREDARSCESAFRVQLAPALAKGEKLDWIIQKGTELGVDRFHPLVTLRAELRLEGDRIESRMSRWRRVALEACKQSGRTRIPEILPPAGLDQLLRRELPATRIVLDPSGVPTDRLLQGLDIHSAPSALAAVGPEGGWKLEELSMLHDGGFVSWALGPRILRTETAAIFAAGLLQVLAGDLKGREILRPAPL